MNNGGGAIQEDGKLFSFGKQRQPELSRIKRQLRRRMKMVQEIEAEFQKLESELSAPSPEAYREMVRAGRPLTFEAHLLATIRFIHLYLSEACLVAEEYGSMTPSQFSGTNRRWRPDLLESLGYAVDLEERPLALEDEEEV